MYYFATIWCIRHGKKPVMIDVQTVVASNTKQAAALVFILVIGHAKARKLRSLNQPEDQLAIYTSLKRVSQVIQADQNQPDLFHFQDVVESWDIQVVPGLRYFNAENRRKALRQLKCQIWRRQVVFQAPSPN